MYYAYKYRLKPSDAHREELDRHQDICRQLYNHTLYRLNGYQDGHGELPSMTSLWSELPDLKKWRDDISDAYSKVLQTVVERLFDNLNGLSELKQNGYGVDQLKWKPPREFRSFTYSQSGFKLDKKGGQTVLSLSKLADIPIRLHRAIPDVHKSNSSCAAHQKSPISEDDATLKQVTLKKEPIGEWFATFGVHFDRASAAGRRSSLMMSSTSFVCFLKMSSRGHRRGLVHSSKTATAPHTIRHISAGSCAKQG